MMRFIVFPRVVKETKIGTLFTGCRFDRFAHCANWLL